MSLLTRGGAPVGRSASVRRSSVTASRSTAGDIGFQGKHAAGLAVLQNKVLEIVFGERGERRHRLAPISNDEGFAVHYLAKKLVRLVLEPHFPSFVAQQCSRTVESAASG